MNDNNEIARRLMNLIDEAANRQQEYSRIVKQLREDKAYQANEYLQKLQKLYDMMVALTNKKTDSTDHEFKTVNLRHLQSLKDKPHRDYRKQLYTVQDIDKFGLAIDIRFLYITPELNDYFSDYYPKNIQIVFNFNKQIEKTGLLNYGNAKTKESILEALASKYPFVLVKEEDNQPPEFQIRLRVDAHTSKKSIERMIKFMERDCLNIEVWDADSKFLYGQTKLPLKQLLYYSKNEDLWTQTFQLYSPLRTSVVAKLDMQFKNSKIALAQNDIFSTEKVKVRSKQPMKLSIGLDYDINSVSEKEQRMLRRINKFKQQHLASGQPVYNFQSDYLDKQMQKRRLDQAIKLKEQNKMKYTSQLMSKINQSEEFTECPQGQPVYFTLAFTNTFSISDKFRVDIQGLQKDSTEFVIITDPNQWSFLCKEYKFDEPSRFSMFSQGNSCYLVSRETLTIILRFLSWRKSKSERQFKCFIYNSNNELVQKGSFKIVPSEPQVDHTFRLYNFLNSVVDLDIPFPESSTYKSPGFYTAEPGVKYLWSKNSAKVTLKINFTKKSTFMVFIYTDTKYSKLLFSYKIQVYVYPECKFENMDIASQYDQNLEMPPVQNDIQVIFKTSNPSISWVNSNQLMPTKLAANSVNFAKLTVRVFEPQYQEKILINCLRSSNKDVIYQWCAIVKTRKPEYKSTYEVACSTEKQTLFKIKISNVKNKKTVFGIISSNLSYIQIPKNKRQLHAHEASMLELSILPHEQQNKQVTIHVSDRQQTVSLIYLIRLHYTRNYHEEQQKQDKQSDDNRREGSRESSPMRSPKRDSSPKRRSPKRSRRQSESEQQQSRPKTKKWGKKPTKKDSD